MALNVVHITRSCMSSLSSFAEKAFLEQKLRNTTGAIMFGLMALLLGYLMTHAIVLGLGITGLVAGITVLTACMANPETGLLINTVYGFLGFEISRWLFKDQLPVGVVSDVLVMATLLSFLISKKQYKVQISEFAKDPIAILFFVFAGYTAIELCNPSGSTFAGWFIAFRKALGIMSILYIAYLVFDSVAAIRRFLKVLFIMATLTGIYGCIQEWHGFFGFDQEWATSDPHRLGLMFVNGIMRKMGTMSDPAEYSIVMASCAALFIVLGIFDTRFWYKFALFAGSLFMLLGMGYSGTRTANAMIVAGLFVYILLTIDKPATKRFAIVGVLVFLFLLFAPIYNPTIIRFRSTFNASEDASYNVREKNRHFIQPYIYTHPLGGGFGTTGAVGESASSGHFLAGFQTDSGYLKKAVESGWIGLLIACIMYFSILKAGTRAYFGTDDHQMKGVYAGAVAALFSYYVAEFSQSAIGQVTDIFVYYPLVAIVMKARTLPLNTTHIQQGLS